MSPGRTLMAPGLKEDWLVALRSGKYKQISGQLKTTEGHCCLGVLCEVAGVTWDQRGTTFGVIQNGSYREDAILPTEVRERAGLPNNAPNSYLRLSEMNDDGATFAELADYIEANY